MSTPRNQTTAATDMIVSLILVLQLASFNVRGLSKEEKQNLLDLDCMSYQLDVVALQETKVTKAQDIILPSRNRLIFMKQTDGYHGGLGFLISKRLNPYVVQWSYISDRVSFIDFKVPGKNGSPFHFRCVNIYSPTNTKAMKNNSLSAKFYSELDSAMNVPSRFELFVMGDFNGKIGRLNKTDMINGLDRYIGRYAMGTRNYNGDCLLNFVCTNDLFVTNTAFQHSSRHCTTHTASVTYNSGKKVFSQIDYILCKRRSKCLIDDARSYGGTLVVSDHKLVVCKVNTGKRCLLSSTPTIKQQKYQCHRLASCKETQALYRTELTKMLHRISDKTTKDPNEVMKEAFKGIHTSAKKTVGLKAPKKKCHYTNDPKVVELSELRRRKRLELEGVNKLSNNSSDLRATINQLQRDISKRLKELQNNSADRLAEEITSTDESRVMFEAVRSLCKTKESKPITVHNLEGNPVGTDEEKARVIQGWYEKKFNGNDPPLEPFEGPAAPLAVPISSLEVEIAAKKLKNGKSSGPDNTPNEFLKYASDPLFKLYADQINRCFEENTFLDSVGQCYITPLQKPNKPPGDVKSLRPLTLCNGTRKLLSLITLRRIEGKVNCYTGPWQCAYKPKRSCADLVWCQRILVSVVLEKKWSFHKMGLDMSSAFDTIRRGTILNLLKDAGCSRDEIRLVRFLLSNTKIRVKVNKNVSIEFMSSIGGPQGDSLSGTLFTLVLAGALYHLRAVTSRPTPPIQDNGMPEESEYSDDVDFMSTDLRTLEDLLPIATNVFKEWNLEINTGKTEFVNFRVADRSEKLPDGTPLRGNEEWCKSKLLGSLMCSTEDIKRRCNLGNAAFSSFKKVWMNSKITLEKKLKIYEAQVVSVMMYNSSCWAAPKHILEKLDICHRKHLRSIMNIKWPRSMISNKTLYNRCSSTPLSTRAEQSRWRMLGHVLRSPENSPAQAALCFALESMNVLPGRLGRHRSNLFSFIRHDLENRNIPFRQYEDLLNVRTLAWNRAEWKCMTM